MSGVPVLLLELMEVVGKPVLPAAARLHRLIPGQRGREYCYTPTNRVHNKVENSTKRSALI